MTTINPEKPTFPDTTAEIADMLNLSDSTMESSEVTHHKAAPGNLPIIEAVSTPVSEDHSGVNQPENHDTEVDDSAIEEEAEKEAQPVILENIKDPKARAFRIVKTVAPYVAVFVVGLFVYQYFFSSFSVANLLNSSQSSSDKVAGQSQNNTRLEDLKKQEASAYNTWIHQFFFDVSDPSIIDMDNDLSGNGLTNFEKFLFNLNPKAYDTLGLGQPDGQTILDGINPWTGKPLTDNQKAIVDNYLDTQIISDRLAAGSLKLSQNGIPNASTAPGSAGYENPNNYSFVDGTGASSGGAHVAGASTNQPNSSTGSASLVSLDINQSIPGHLDIPSNKISVPLIFTSDTKYFDSDLHKGVVHYPGTALPGQAGTAYIAGHSSGYIWDKNAYKNVFRGLGNVKDGTSFTITVTLNDGRKATIHYVVDSRQEFQASDQAQFLQTSDARVALSTCWPVDTSKERLVLFAHQTQVSF